MRPKVLSWVFLAGAMAILPGALTYSQTVDSFNPSPNSVIEAAVPLPNGKMLFCGNFSKICGQTRAGLARISQGGSLDSSFTNQISLLLALQVGVQCIAVQTNGQVVLGGSFSRFNTSDWCHSIARINADDTMDTNFDRAYTNGAETINCLALQPDGKIVVAATTDWQAGSNGTLYRINSDGTLDTNFSATVSTSWGHYCLYSVGLQPDTKLVILGTFTTVDNQACTNLARLNADGSLDTTFLQPNFAYRGSYNINEAGGTLLIQPDGKILIGGWFDHVDGQAHTNIVRLNADGSLDTNFNAQADFSSCYGVQSLALQTDGRILVGHDSVTFDGQPNRGVTRLNVDGTLDSSFRTNLFLYAEVIYSLALQADARIMVGGEFGKLDGQAREDFARLINTGAATQSLTNDGTNLTWLRGGASPEVWRTSFESSADGTNWAYLGDGVRISGGWALSNTLTSANAKIRARGFVTGGRYNGSSWFVESTYPTTVPQFVPGIGNLGWSTNQFDCDISGSAGSSVEVDESSNLVNWTPFATNLIYNGPLQFADPTATNAPQRFYRLRLL